MLGDEVSCIKCSECKKCFVYQPIYYYEMYLQLTNRILVVASQVLNMMNTYRQHNGVRVYAVISHRLMAVFFFIFKGQYIMTKLFYYLAVDLCLFKWILPVFIVNDNNLKTDLFP